MVSEGPTTAGSINAKLTLDDHDFMAKLAAADAAARKLGSADPNISIDVDDRGAISKLAAVDAAANRLDGSTRRLNVSQRQLNDTNGNGVQRWQLIAAAIVALIPLLGPLAAYAVGVGGALAGMGAAGALAVYGIVKAIKDATIVGDQYKAGLGQLKGALDSLGGTAANVMLEYFGVAVQMINRALPDLNRQIATFANILGQTGLSVLDATISAFHIMNPLFVQGAQYVRSLAQGFNSWVQNGGLNQFVNYAIAHLPEVAQMLGSLASAALHLVVAFAPLGDIVVAALKLLGDTINAIPVPVLLEVGSAAAAGFAAFKLWTAVAPILQRVATAMGAVGIATQIAQGPIGWVTAGVSALAAAFAVGVAAMQDQSQAANDYAQALQQDNNQIKENVRLTAVKNLHDSGAIKAGHELGISTSTLTEAAVGNADAMALVSARLGEVEKGLGTAGGSTGAMTAKQQEQAGAIVSVRDALGSQNTALDAAKIIQQENADAVGGANSKIGTNIDLLGAMKAATDKAATATDELARKLQGLGQVNLDASTANVQYQQSIADVTAAVAQNGATLDLNSQQGRDNQRALDGLASSGIALVAAQAKAGASGEALTATMQTVHDQFVNAAVGAGMSRDAAEKLATQYGLVPKDVSTAFNTSGIQQAKDDAAALKAAYDAITRNLTIHVNEIFTSNQAAQGRGSQVQGNRDGGTIHAAYGMTVPGGGSAHVDSVPAMLAPLEEVISNRFGQASNNRMLLKAINGGANRLQVAQLANRQAGVAPQAAPPVYVTVTSNGVDLSKFIDVRVEQGGKRLLTQAAQEYQGGIV